MIRYFTAIRELELANARIEELKKEKAELHAQLLSEIDSNRKREDALVSQLTARDARGEFLPQRALLRGLDNLSKKVDSDPLINLDDPDEAAVKAEAEAEDRLIVQRATEMWRQAQAAGNDYPLEIGIEVARRDPHFLDN